MHASHLTRHILLQSVAGIVDIVNRCSANTAAPTNSITKLKEDEMTSKKMLLISLLASLNAHAAETDVNSPMSPPLATTVCIACHGANGISVAGHIPNLAGQRANYLSLQLRQFKSGNRKNESMQAIAAQLSNADISALAKHFSALPAMPIAAVSGQASLFPPNFAKTNVVMPADFKSRYTRYHTLNLPTERQLKVYYANDVAIAATKAGKSLPDGATIIAEVFSIKLDQNKQPIIGSDGFFVQDQLLVYSTMARQAGWGEAFPELLRNENWHYALYSKDNKLLTGPNQAECLACHKPEAKSSYVFTYKSLLAHVQQQ
jgi:cytochrome c553